MNNCEDINLLGQDSILIYNKGGCCFDLSPLKNLRQSINSIIDILTSDFLSLGKLLQENYLIAKDAINILFDIIGTTSDEEIKNSFSGIYSVLSNLDELMERFVKEAAGKSLVLNDIDASLITISRVTEDFNKIIKHLRVLGISTKIENARLNSDNTGFATIAESVDGLSETIEGKSRQIRNRALRLLNDVRQLLDSINGIRIDQEKNSALIIRKANESISSYQKTLKSSCDESHSLHDISSGISSGINELIILIQVQDIIKQQLEHAAKAMQDFYDLYPGGLIPAEDRASVSKLLSVCLLQSAQIKHSGEEISVTARRIGDNIKFVEQGMTQIAGNNDCQGFQDIEAGIESVEESLRTVSVSLEGSFQMDENLSGAINLIAHAIPDLQKYVLEIEEIGAEIENIAVNARIKAAHLGDEGAALGVLSEAIQKLSAQAKDLSQGISECLIKVMNNASHLIEQSNQGRAEKLEKFTSLESMLKQLLGNMQRGKEKSLSLKSLLNERLILLSGKISLIHGGIQNEPSASCMISHIIFILDNYIKSAREMGVELSEDDKAQLENLSLRYTMNSERRIHQSVMEQKMFNQSGSNTKENSPECNVELF